MILSYPLLALRKLCPPECMIRVIIINTLFYCLTNTISAVGIMSLRKCFAIRKTMKVDNVKAKIVLIINVLRTMKWR